jgi:hypothetical protein
MPILTDDQIAEIRANAADDPHDRLYDMRPLRTRAEIFGYCIEVARQRGWDEVEVIDALLRVATPYREDVREVERVLRLLGYAAVADHLHKIARHLSKKPPRRWPHSDISDQSWRRGHDDPVLH